MRGPRWLLLAACAGCVASSESAPAGGDAAADSDARIARDDAREGVDAAGANDAVTGADAGAESGGTSDVGLRADGQADTGGDPADAGIADGAQLDGGDPPAGGFPAFVAQGVMGRTLVSCDDGRTWVRNQSQDDAYVCGDCDHHPWAAAGLAAADGWVFTGWGHGAPGRLRRSADGFQWEDVLVGVEINALAAGRHTVMASPWGGDKPYVSTNDGMSFATGPVLPLKIWPRKILFLPRGSQGRLLFAAKVGALEVQYTDDACKTWTAAQALPPACDPTHLAYGNGVALMIGTAGGVCRSLDHGATWQVAAGSAKGVEVAPLFAGGKFMAWGFPSGQTVFESTDGELWTTRKQTASVNAAAASDEGTLVASFERYDRQSFSRSTDGGLTWTPLGAGTFPKGHPIKAMVFARLAKDPCRMR